jgi:hypothetical protein
LNVAFCKSITNPSSRVWPEHGVLQERLAGEM